MAVTAILSLVRETYLWHIFTGNIGNIIMNVTSWGVVPQDAHVLIPWTWECLTYTVKGLSRRDYVKDLEMGRHPGWVRWAWCRLMCPYLREAERDVTREEKCQWEKVYTVHGRLWRWRQGLRAKEYRRPWEAGKGKETDSPLEPPGGMKACWHLDSSQ